MVSPKFHSNVPVSSLLDREGSVELCGGIITGGTHVISPKGDVVLELPVDLPMLAAEVPVMHASARPESVWVSCFDKQTLFGIFEDEETVGTEKIQIRRDSRLAEVPLQTAMKALKKHANRETFGVSNFSAAVREMFAPNAGPSEFIVAHLFGAIDVHKIGVVPDRTVATAIALLTQSKESERISTIFTLADVDNDGALSIDELVEFFRLVFSCVLTRSVMGIMSANGVAVTSMQQLAVTTAIECMRMCDLNKDGSLCLDEFTRWFQKPKLAPLLPVSPFVTSHADPIACVDPNQV